MESPSSPTIQPDELLLLMDGLEGVSYSDALVDSCECFPLMRKVVGIEASQEHGGVSCSAGSSCWVLTSELLTPLDTLSGADVSDLGLTDLQDVPWESLVGDLCVPGEINGRRLLGECRDTWEGTPCPSNDCPEGKCYECSSKPDGCDNGCGPAKWPSLATRLLAELTPFGNGCCNHDYCWSAKLDDKEGCDVAFWRDNLAGCLSAFGLLAFLDPRPLAACNIIGTGFYLAVKYGGDEAHAEAVEKQKAWELTCEATPAPSTPPEPVSLGCHCSKTRDGCFSPFLRSVARAVSYWFCPEPSFRTTYLLDDGGGIPRKALTSQSGWDAWGIHLGVLLFLTHVACLFACFSH